MILVREERPGDVGAIRAVHEVSFPTPAEARLVDALRDAGRLWTSLVAEADGVVVGHVGFSPVSAGAEIGTGLAPVAVLAGYRRRGVADRLIREGLADRRRAGDGFAVVLGEPEYDARFGFLPASRWGLADEYGGGDAFRAIELKAGGVPIGAGLVRYTPEFATLGECLG